VAAAASMLSAAAPCAVNRYRQMHQRRKGDRGTLVRHSE
jgi:hypothetical protein